MGAEPSSRQVSAQQLILSPLFTGVRRSLVLGSAFNTTLTRLGDTLTGPVLYAAFVTNDEEEGRHTPCSGPLPPRSAARAAALSAWRRSAAVCPRRRWSRP